MNNLQLRHFIMKTFTEVLFLTKTNVKKNLNYEGNHDVSMEWER